MSCFQIFHSGACINLFVGIEINGKKYAQGSFIFVHWLPLYLIYISQIYQGGVKGIAKEYLELIVYLL